jgi:Type II secretion system (T2SS), protein G
MRVDVLRRRWLRWVALCAAVAAGASVAILGRQSRGPQTEDARAGALAAQLVEALHLYRATYGTYPSTLDKLRTEWRGLDLVDPWGRAFEYSVHVDGSVGVRSAGRDGMMKTADDITVVR